MVGRVINTYYTRLGVSENASLEEIKKAYHRKVLENHPDKQNNSIESKEEFIKIQKAYECLSDKTRRQKYDESLRELRNKADFIKEYLHSRGVSFACYFTKENVRYEHLRELKGWYDPTGDYIFIILPNFAFLSQAESIDALEHLLHIRYIHKGEVRQNSADTDNKEKKNHGSFNLLPIVLSIIAIAFFLIFGGFFIYNISNENTDIKQFTQYKIYYEEKPASLEKLYNKLGEKIGAAPYSVEEFKRLAADPESLGRFYDSLERTGKLKMDISREHFIERYLNATDAIRNKNVIYRVNGNRYNIPIDKMQDFERRYPESKVEMYDGEGKKYAIPLSKRNKFQQRYEKWSYVTEETKKKSPNIFNNETNLERDNSQTEFEFTNSSYKSDELEQVMNNMDNIRYSYVNTSDIEKYIQYETGDIPYSGYFGKGSFNKESLSFLDIKNHSGLDAVVLLENYYSGKIIRNVFISAHSTYKMKNIPEGRYIMKTMYGNSWNKEKNNGSKFPKGGFMRNVSYDKTSESDIFDFTFERGYDYINYPTWEVTLHKVRNGNLQTVPNSKNDFFN